MSDRAPAEESPSDKASRWRHRFFQLAIVLKGIDGVLEILGAVLLLVFGPSGVSGAASFPRSTSWPRTPATFSPA